MSRIRPITAALAVTLMAASVPAHAQRWDLVFRPEGVSTPGLASGFLELTGQELRLNVAFADLTSGTTVSHIHCCTASPFVGNAGVASTVPSFAGFPVGVRSGSFDQTWNIFTDVSFWNAVFLANNGATAANLTPAANALVGALQAGRAYVNIHTQTNPGGELRAYTTPEPQTWALLATGIGVLGAIARRRAGRATAGG